MRPGAPADATFDLTLILNVHDETRYLARTLRSCAEAVRFAQAQGARCELVVVLDRPAADTAGFIQAYDFAAFDGWRVVVADHGSLGLARNAGIAHASGTYITTCDADDLISFNAFAEMLAAARSAGPDVIFVPQYLLMFGAEHYAVEYFPSSIVTPLMFLAYQPYHSRLFAHHRVFAAVPYGAAHPGSGYVYEDWHFNCQAIAHGFQFAVVPETVLFCRRRGRSLLTESNRTLGPQIPPSALFAPRVYLALCRAAMDAWDGRSPPLFETLRAERQGGTAAVLADPVIRELLCAANAIDPAVDPGPLAPAPFWTNLTNSLAPGAAYFRLCERVGATPFSDIVLLPAAAPASLLRYMRAVVDAIRACEPRSRVLLLSWDAPAAGMPAAALFDGADPDIVHVDLRQLAGPLHEPEMETLIVKALQSLGPQARVHLVPDVATMAFAAKFRALLARHAVLFYRFPDPVRRLEARELRSGAVFDNLSETFEIHSAIIVPDPVTRSTDQARLGIGLTRWHELPPPGGAMLMRERPGRRLLCLPQDLLDAAALLPRAAVSAAGPWRVDAPADWPALEEIDLAVYDAVLCLDWSGPAASWVLRALGCGTPVLAHRQGAAVSFPGILQEALFDAPLGAGPGTCAGLLERMAARSDWWHALREAARAYRETHCSPAAFTRGMGAILEGIEWTRERRTGLD